MVGGKLRKVGCDHQETRESHSFELNEAAIQQFQKLSLHDSGHRMVLMIKKSCFKILETEEKGVLEMEFTGVTVEETSLERINNMSYVTQ